MNVYLEDIVKSLNKTIEELLSKNVQKEKQQINNKPKSTNQIKDSKFHFEDSINSIIDHQHETINTLLAKTRYYEIEITMLKKQKEGLTK